MVPNISYFFQQQKPCPKLKFQKNGEKNKQHFFFGFLCDLFCISKKYFWPLPLYRCAKLPNGCQRCDDECSRRAGILGGYINGRRHTGRKDFYWEAANHQNFHSLIGLVMDTVAYFLQFIKSMCFYVYAKLVHSLSLWHTVSAGQGKDSKQPDKWTTFERSRIKDYIAMSEKNQIFIQGCFQRQLHIPQKPAGFRPKMSKMSFCTFFVLVERAVFDQKIYIWDKRSRERKEQENKMEECEDVIEDVVFSQSIPKLGELWTTELLTLHFQTVGHIQK